MSTASATAGELIAGKYRVTRKLDSGGMADVFLARVEGAAGFSRTVVIKRLAPGLAREPDVVTMFLDEARIAARLHHSNIAQVFDFGTDASGYYLAMEFLAGRDALDLVRAAHPGQLPLAAAVAIVVGAAAGLHHAHEQRDDVGRPLGIVHRDVTSSNVFVTIDGAVKVIDFGIARAADRATVTRAGTVKGTTAYLSPEQASGGPLDRRSDLFQLGIVLYELVTGARPFDERGDGDLVIANKIAAGVFAPARTRRPDCPRDLDALIARLLAVDPARRLPTGESVIAELDALIRRYGWSTAPHELARVVRELFPVHPGGDTPDTAVDGAPGDARTDAETAPASGPAAILAGLEAPRQRTAPNSDRVDTVRGKTPSAAGRGPEVPTIPAPPGMRPLQGIPTVEGPPPPPPPPPPAPAIAIVTPRPESGRRTGLAIAAVSLVAGAALLVYALGTFSAGRPSVVVAEIDARAPPAPAVDAADLDDVTAGMTAAQCLDSASIAIHAVRTAIASDDKAYRIRETWGMGKMYIGESIGYMPELCRNLRDDSRRDAADAELDALETQIRVREDDAHLEFGYIDDAGLARYKDAGGDWLTREQVEAR